MVRKILRSLSKAWHPKVTTIQEAKVLNVLSLDALIGSLKTHEIELNEVSEETTRKGKSIALKSTQKRTQSSKAMKALEELEKDEEDPLKLIMMIRLYTWQGRYQKHGSKGRKRALFPRRTRRARLSKMKSFASNARNLDISDQNILD